MPGRVEMDKEKNPTKFETLKEELVNIPDNTPSFIGIPAHPFPKYIPKEIALTIIIILISIFLIGGIYEIIKIIK